MALSDQDAVLIAKVWLKAWRREWIKIRPNEQCPVLAWEDYSIQARQSMLTTLRLAITLAEPKELTKLRLQAANSGLSPE